MCGRGIKTSKVLYNQYLRNEFRTWILIYYFTQIITINLEASQLVILIDANL